MNRVLQAALRRLAAINNPFTLNLAQALVVPTPTGRVADYARVQQAFLPVAADLTRVTRKELARHGVSAN